MQTKEQIIKTVKVVILCTISFILILTIYHFFINRSQTHKKKEENKINYKLEVINEDYRNASYCAGGYYLIDSGTENKDNTLILNEKLDLIETFNLPLNKIYCLYDNYYLVDSNGTYILKRNGSIIKNNLDFSNPMVNRLDIYHDETDSKALYINYLYLYDIINNKRHFYNNGIVYASIDLNNYAGLIFNAKNGTIIDSKVAKAYLINSNNKMIRQYLYVKGINDYLYDINNQNKLLEGKELIFASVDEDNNVCYNNSENNIIYHDIDGYGIANFNGNIILKAKNQNLVITDDNTSYFITIKDGKYGLINAFGSQTLENNYDYIYAAKEFILVIKNKQLTIYDNNLKIISDEYQTVDNKISVQKYANFYQIKNVFVKEPKELIITFDGQINLVNSLNGIKYSELFYDNLCYLINLDGKYYIYFSNEEKKNINTDYKENVTKALMPSYNRLYTELPFDGKIRYNFYRINTGTVIESYTKEKVDVEFEVFGVNNLIFSRENNKISIYNGETLYDEITALKITHLHDDYYLITKDDGNSFVKIEQK